LFGFSEKPFIQLLGRQAIRQRLGWKSIEVVENLESYPPQP
jgi:hypothetical protein